MDLLDLATIGRTYGRGVVFRAPGWIPGQGDPLVLTHLGDTEGDIVVNTNAEVAGLTTPELTGGAIHEADHVGESPLIEIPLYLADPTLLALVTPRGSAHGGTSRRSAPAEHTLVILPEQLFLEDVNGVPTRRSVTFDGGVWEFDGNPLSAAQEALLAFGFWAWRGFFNRPPRRFRGGAGDEKKNIETVSFQLMHHPDMPDGHHLYTIGDPIAEGIDLDGGS